MIEKAIEKASGAGGEDFVTARYEGYGPGGSAIIVDCLTDNNNRTITDVRNCFTKTGVQDGGTRGGDPLLRSPRHPVIQRNEFR